MGFRPGGRRRCQLLIELYLRNVTKGQQSGPIMSAATFLASNLGSTDTEIGDAIEAIKQAAQWSGKERPS